MSHHVVASVSNVAKTYASGAAAVRALQAIDLEVHAGELVLLEGPSGSGKTTLLSILGCILKPSSGRVTIGSREVSCLPEHRLPEVRLRHIGFVFQSFNLLPALSVRENVQMPLDLKRVSSREGRRRAADLLQTVGLGSKLNALPSALSGGEKQRVAIARAAITDPDLLLADEPTAALDSASGQAIMRLLREFGRQHGRAVVVVSHDPRWKEFADRVVRLEDGRLV
ncbi:MAG TPA: ABC transporter ATP-binding protein [Bryobacteraceae bacterium]|jgi:putative ABC transport system ATP-binding protein|nr:ABC transporter ATP-binding protein [Bryobacteraceae bacterium]